CVILISPHQLHREKSKTTRRGLTYQLRIATNSRVSPIQTYRTPPHAWTLADRIPGNPYQRFSINVEAPVCSLLQRRCRRSLHKRLAAIHYEVFSKLGCPVLHKEKNSPLFTLNSWRRAARSQWRVS